MTPKFGGYINLKLTFYYAVQFRLAWESFHIRIIGRIFENNFLLCTIN